MRPQAALCCPVLQAFTLWASSRPCFKLAGAGPCFKLAGAGPARTDAEENLAQIVSSCPGKIGLSVLLGQSQAYRVLRRGDIRRAGVLLAPDEVSAQWLPYVRVEDAAGTAARAVKLGAEVVSQDEDGAILIDPTGAAIGVQSWDGPREQGS